MSQDDLFDKIGISKPYLSNIKNGKNNLSLINALKIAEVFNNTLDEMLKEIKV